MEHETFLPLLVKGDDFPDIPPQTVTEEKFIDDHGNMIVKKVRTGGPTILQYSIVFET